MFIAVEPRFKEPLYNEFLRIKNDFLQLRQSYKKYIEQNVDVTNLDNFSSNPHYDKHNPETQTQNIPQHNK